MEGPIPPDVAGTSRRPRLALALEYALLQHGGTEVLVRELLRGLAKQFEIVLVSGDRNQADLGPEFGPLVSGHFHWDLDRVSRSSARELAGALAASGVKLVHFHSGFVYAWQSHKAWQSPIFHAAQSGLPCLTTTHLVQTFLHGYGDPARPAWQRLLLLPKAWLSKAIILQRTKVEFMVSKHDQEAMRRFYPPFTGKLRQMYHSTLVADDKEPASAPRAKVVLCLGTFGERKGQVHLAAAFASIAKRHPDWTLQLIGRQDHADYVGKVKAIADGAVANGQIQLLPPALEARPLLQSSSIFAMPSTAEGLGLSLQEALYHGCACVGSAVGGIPELIENEKTGLLVLPGDEAALAAALDRLMSDGDLRARVAKSGRASIIEKGMLAGLMVERHARLYESILAGGNLPAMPG